MNASHENKPEPSDEPHEFHHEELAASSRASTRWVRRSVITLLLIVVLVPPFAGFYSFFSGVPLHLLASSKDKDNTSAPSVVVGRTVSPVPGEPDSIDVPDDVARVLGIVKDDEEMVKPAVVPNEMMSLTLPASTYLNPSRLARIKPRFAPARVIELAQVHDFSHKAGESEFRELREGDTVKEGDLLGIFYSIDVGTKKNDLIDALVQIELDQKIMDRIEENRFAIPEVYYLTQWRTVQGDRNAITKALNSLKLWDIPQEEIDDLHAEALKISADKEHWTKTPEGQWVKGVEQADDPVMERENPWGRVTLRAPFDGVVVEQNVHAGEMLTDPTVNLFQIADVSRLKVVAYCPEDDLPKLEGLVPSQRQWIVRANSAFASGGLPGYIDSIGYVVEPNQHMVPIKGYVENPGQNLRAGQNFTATVKIPAPDDVVEIPPNALIDDGLQSLVFVKSDEGKHRFSMRRVQVTHRFEDKVFVQSSEIPADEQLTEQEKEAGLMPKQPLRPDEFVLVSGAIELKAKLLSLKSEMRHDAHQAEGGNGISRQEPGVRACESFDFSD
jgi:cobalt-zinc-cadmium efflux system membrane fusion protein